MNGDAVALTSGTNAATGFLLPQLRHHYSPLVSSLPIALVWGGIWHLYGNQPA